MHLGADSDGSNNAAYIERLNLTIRNSLAGSCENIEFQQNSE